MRRNITQIHSCAKASWLSLYGDCKEYVTSFFEVRWWSTKEGRYKKTKVSIRRNGGYKKALRKTLEVQQEKENAEAN